VSIMPANDISMIYSDFQGLQLSKLGFGTMRLPLLEDKSIDKEMTARMVDYAMSRGINYFDTAFPYHGGYSETVMGELLSKYPRDSFFLADKYPGHQHVAEFNPAKTFETQLKKCKVDYFDMYLLHNVCENSIANYRDERWKIIEYFIEQRRLGRIRHLGFSSHAETALLEEFVDSDYGKEMEFCQIQLNYLDWTLQNAKRKSEILNERNIPIIVMEPLRGGRLARLPEDACEKLKALRPDETIPAWAFRWLQSLPGVAVVLSGMSAFDQMVDNVAAFEEEKPLSAYEEALLYEMARSLYTEIPCTACRYCCDACPQGLDIPNFMRTYSDFSLESSFTPLMRMEALEPDKRPDQCLGCGACMQICPQGIKIPDIIALLNEKIASVPSWASICRDREEAAKKFDR